MTSINEKLIGILEDKGPMLSGELSRAYEVKYNVLPINARKAISRSKKPINKLRKIKFDNNQRFIYLDKHYMKSIYKDHLLRSIQKSSKTYHSVIKTLQDHHGFMNIAYIAAYSILPIEPLKGHRSFDSIIGELEDLGIVMRMNDVIYMLAEEYFLGHNYSKYKAIELAKLTILDDFNEWSRRINLTAFNSGKKLMDKAIFSKFQWCYSSPSYIKGIRDVNNPGVIVADILIDTTVKIADIQFFMSKINIIRQFKNGLNFVPAFIAESIEKDAFDVLKQNGVLILQIGNLFSSSYENALKNLVDIVGHASAIISKNPDRFINYLEDLRKMEGKFNNVQGQLFELVVGYHYSLSCRYFEINKLIQNRNGKRNEIDVYVVINNEIRVVECKGYKHKLDVEYVKKWLTEKITNIRSWIIDREGSTKTISFELWCTGGFDNEALEVLEKQSRVVKKYKIEYFNRTEIIKRAKSMNDKVLLDVVNKYF